MSIGSRIKAARERRGLSQEQLGKLVGVSRAAVQQWEANVTAPKRARALAVAKALDLPPPAIDPRFSSGLAALSGVDTTTQPRQILLMSWDRVADLQRGMSLGDLTNGQRLQVDGDIPADTIALIVVDESMEPVQDGVGGFCVGDIIVASGSVAPRRGDIVVAKTDSSGPMLRIYTPRGSGGPSGTIAFDLSPTHPEYPTVTVNSTNTGWVVATVIEHRRKLRR